MKVLHVVNWHRGGGGSDNAARATIDLSRERGLDVSVFERDSRDLSNGLSGKVKAFSSGFYAGNALADLKRRVERDRPDVVHTHEIFPLISPWVFKMLSELGIPVVHAVYDFRMTCPVATHFNGQEVCTRCLDGTALSAIGKNCRDSVPESTAFGLRHEMARRLDLYRPYIDRYIVLTPFSQNWLVSKAGIDPARISVSGCVVPASESPVDPSISEVIGFAGRPVPEKGINVLLEAANRLGRRVKASVPESAKGALPDLPGLDISVTSDREELRQFYRSCRFLVVPSLWFETFCLVAVEAQAEGVPTIASRIGALQDTVIDGVTGLHVDVGDPSSLTAGMERMLADDELCRRLGSSAHGRVREDFSQDTYFGLLMDAYHGALQYRKAA